MTMIHDFKGRLYRLVEARRDSTLLECLATGERVVLRNYGWGEIGFIKP